MLSFKQFIEEGSIKGSDVTSPKARMKAAFRVGREKGENMAKTNRRPSPFRHLYMKKPTKGERQAHDSGMKQAYMSSVK